MLPQEIIREVGRLLAAGEWSRRRIAAHLGVGRSTVDLIATGRRGLHGSLPRDEDHPPHAPDGALPARCPGCGARVFLPCIACRARDYGYRREKGREKEWRKDRGTAA